ncbi:MAG: Hsp20/alpha crystallin family protein [Candidatus Woesearchaeota archaeon]
MKETSKSIWKEIMSLQNQIDMLFENSYLEEYLGASNLLKKGNITPENYRKPISNIHETDTKIIAEIEMPGMNKEDIDVEVDDNTLKVKAEKKQEIKEKDKKESYSYKRDFLGFYKKFLLPENVDSQKAKAEYNEGILKINLPKIEIESSKKNRLNIK